LTPIEINKDQAEYFFTRTIGGHHFAFIMTFVKENGLWKIRTL
jgi:hypothetical protein